jgi:hypothetical protein
VGRKEEGGNPGLLEAVRRWDPMVPNLVSGLALTGTRRFEKANRGDAKAEGSALDHAIFFQASRPRLTKASAQFVAQCLGAPIPLFRPPHEQVANRGRTP